MGQIPRSTERISSLQSTSVMPITTLSCNHIDLVLITLLTMCAVRGFINLLCCIEKFLTIIYHCNIVQANFLHNYTITLYQTCHVFSRLDNLIFKFQNDCNSLLHQRY